MKLESIVVTGCGGDIGSSVGRLLKKEKTAHRIIGIDKRKYHAGLAFFDEVYQALSVQETTYLDSLTQLIEKVNADLVIPITDAELAFFAQKAITTIGRAHVIMPNNFSIITGLDKLRTFEVLSEAGIPMPKTGIMHNEAFPRFPCIVKKRYGHGGKDFFIIHNQEDYLYCLKNHPDSLYQDYLPDANAEYTCGLFRGKSGEIRTFILRRQLIGGLTGEGIVEDQPEIRSLLIQVANVLDLRGSINVQLRMTDQGPRIFEINPRFSSTVYFRHLLGFNDVIWSIRDKLDQPLSDYIYAPIGTRIYRTFGEFILSPEEKEIS